MIRWLRRFAYLLLAFVLVGAFGAWLALRLSLPRYDGEARVTGLAAEVRIERDALGTASIEAAHEIDAFRALGYVHAQERYFEMDLMRRAAAGELSGLIGPATRKADRATRTHRMRARARQVLAQATPAQRARVDAYVQGVNEGLGALAARPFPYLLLSTAPVPWRAEDCVLVQVAMFFDLTDADDERGQALGRLSRALPSPLYRLLTTPGTDWDAPLLGAAVPPRTLPGADEVDLRTLDGTLFRGVADVASDIVPGSNNFAVAGAISRSAAAIVANDMHLSLRVPNIWFRARIRYARADGDGVDLIGATLPGVPALVAGSNRRIAWGYTNSYGDWSDLVRVHWLDAAHTRYRTATGEATVVVHDEPIEVRGHDPVAFQVRETIWGPIVAEQDADTSFAVSWLAHRPDAVNLNLSGLEQAADVEAALAIAHVSGLPPQNFLVGDRAGHIAWTIAGRIPRRSDFDASLPADWLAPDAGWQGWVAPDRVPVVRDPEEHRLWSANARIVSGADLALLGDGGYALGARARQIRDGLRARDRYTPQDLLAIQLDDRTVFLQRWWTLLRAALERGGDARLLPLERATVRFDDRASPDARAYRLVRAFRLNVHAFVLDGLLAPARAKDPEIRLPSLPQSEGVVWQLLQERPPHLLARTYRDWDDLLAQAALRVVEDLGSKPGGLEARTWGERNTARIQHPLSRAVPVLSRLLDMPADPLPGDGNMPRVQSPGFGASERFAVSPGYEEEGYFHMPGGQSGHPLSPYYGAGHADWVQGRPTPFLPGPAVSTLTLVSAERP